MTARRSLRDQVRELLEDAAGVYHGTEARLRFEHAAARLDGPLLVAVAGRVKAGKSTLLNALVGQVVAATDAGECTRVVTSYAWGPELSASAVRRDGGRLPVPIRVENGRAWLDLGDLGDLDEIERVDVLVPSASLRRVTLLDTPGIGSLTADAQARSDRLLGDPAAALDDVTPDAVIYLLRQLHVTDVDFLEAFRDPVGRSVPPVNAVGVLSHADEVGGGRPDALGIAGRLAESYSAEPRLRPLVQTVVAVAGLLAQASATLTQSEHDDLVKLAQVDPAVTDPLVLSAARFSAPRRYLPVEPEQRRQLLDRLGVFGVRWALGQARSGQADTLAQLRSCLAEVSGVTVLGAVLESQLTGRRDVLKADAALHLVLQTVMSSPADPVASARLSATAERIRLSVHDFDELRLLNELRLGTIEVPDAERQRMERLLGARGGAVHERLGCPPGVAPDELLHAIRAEHSHWHETGADVLAAPMLTRACATLQRTCVALHAAVNNS